MSGPSIINAKRAGTDGDVDRLPGALASFAEMRSRREFLDLLDHVARTHFGALGAVLLSTDQALISARRMALLAGCAPAPEVQICGPAVAARIGRGAAFVTDAPQADLPGVVAPASARRAVLMPCSGDGSTTAICVFWPAAARHAAEPDRLRLLAAMAGLTFDRLISELRARLLRADMDNRIRNVLAVIRSVGTRSAERAVSMEEFLLHFEGRIDAIGRSQMVAGRPGEISFELLVRDELLAQAVRDDEAHVSIEGIDVSLTSEQAEALGLAMHELAVNAVKFGALSGRGGSLTVRWWVESAAGGLALNIDWREHCGTRPAEPRPARAGFGLTYLEQALPFQLNADVTIGFAREGLRCQIAVPIRTPQQVHSPASADPTARDGGPPVADRPEPAASIHRATDILRR